MMVKIHNFMLSIKSSNSFIGQSALILQERYKCSKFAAGLMLNFGHHLPSKGVGSKTETKTDTHKSVITT